MHPCYFCNAFSSTIITPFRQFDPVISCLSFTICFAIQKNSFWWLGLFKLLAHSFCFFPFAKEIILFAFCLLSLDSFHVTVNFSFFQFPYFFFFPLTASVTSSFHHHVSLWLQGPFDKTHVTCAVHDQAYGSDWMWVSINVIIMDSTELDLGNRTHAQFCYRCR